MPYQELKHRLVKRKVELERQLAALQTDLTQEHSHSLSEQAQERENDDVLNRLARSGAAELIEINQALQRMDQGTYGKCTHCGADIALARLEALPFTPSCVKCSEH